MLDLRNYVALCAIVYFAAACGGRENQPELPLAVDADCGIDGETSAPVRGPATRRFRVAPYLQRVSDHAATIIWYSESANAGSVRIGDAPPVNSGPPRVACELAYHPGERRHADANGPPPYRHEFHLTGLEPGSTYDVAVAQDGDMAIVSVRTPEPSRVRFVVYADSETEPESSGADVVWPTTDGTNTDRRYLIDQTTGYAANLESIAKSDPDFVAIAGDLVESGGEQRDWDEFWRHNAALAASAPIVPALGNHEYYGGPGEFGGYGGEASRRALRKYTSFFDRPPYYSFNHGPIALIVLDLNNGKPERSATDTNWFLNDMAPEWRAGSEQREWLLRVLADAQRDKAFTFVMFHAAPYSSGIHGKPPGVGDGQNFSSGLPIRELTPLFMQFGVDAVFSGHDEMYEHSVVHGEETTSDGSRAKHAIHFFTVGIGGDGLRGSEPGVDNPYRVYSADRDSAERYDAEGVLLDGGKHYGHLAVDIRRADDGTFEAHFQPVYVFPLVGRQEGEPPTFETRVYDDALVLTSRRAR